MQCAWGCAGGQNQAAAAAGARAGEPLPASQYTIICCQNDALWRMPLVNEVEEEQTRETSARARRTTTTPAHTRCSRSASTRRSRATARLRAWCCCHTSRMVHPALRWGPGRVRCPTWVAAHQILHHLHPTSMHTSGCLVGHTGLSCKAGQAGRTCVRACRVPCTRERAAYAGGAGPVAAALLRGAGGGRA